MRIFRSTAIILTIVMGLLNALRAIALLNQREVLLEYGATMPIGLLAMVSALWAVVMVGCGIIAWRWARTEKIRRFRFLIPLLFLTYTLYNVWLPTPTLPYLYGHLFLIFFTLLALTLRNKQHTIDA